MAFSSRSRACGAVLLVGLLVAGCEKKDPLAERKYQILLEENTRLAQAVAALQPGKTAEPAAHTEGYSPAAVTKITAENDHLRDILAGHEHQKALAENKALREPVENR
ncbi:hypothetical protein CfE428DRAFT_1205 [Chthoniobacter flavus Ellin428]|uniref:Lipoprotein n=1 Tax=Chthoniobacter flavus Ellin428 TaxID=497964 RepID=B4CXB4_9BACT|nr:hypothetical protein [Chthoniobacter flavus]EDY20912.1 hypothetical protein CfE428DRAFT_1205 [Chthoniobacter flavus Ellin428]